MKRILFFVLTIISLGAFSQDIQFNNGRGNLLYVKNMLTLDKITNPTNTNLFRMYDTYSTFSKEVIFVNDTIGNAYPVLKRNSSPTANGLFYWNDNSKRAMTSGGFLIRNDSLIISSPALFLNISFDGNLGTIVLHPDTIFTDAIVINGIKTYYFSGEIVDDGTILLPINTTGHGIITEDNAGTITASAYFEYNSDGTTHLSTSSGTVTTDTDANELCIFDNGAGVAIKNRSGATRKINITIWYRNL